MRKSVLLMLLAFCSMMMYAQKTYESLLEEGKVWKMEYKQVVAPEYGDVYYDEVIMLQGDTLIGDIPFKRIYTKGWLRGEQSEPADWSSRNEFIGELDGKIYYWQNSYPATPHIVMDFSLNVGESMVGSEYDEFVVKAVSDTILASSEDKQSRRCISASIKDRGDLDRYSDTWIEGIGSVKGGLKGVDGTFVMGAYPKLLRCEVNGVCIYDREGSKSETLNITTPMDNSYHLNNIYFNLQGRPVKSTPKHGIYIKDGRKVKPIRDL